MATLTPEEKAWIKAHPVINVGNSPLLPYHFREDGVDTGYQVEMTEAMLRMVGLTPRYHWSAKLKDSLDGKLEGKIDVALNMIRTPERVEKYGLSENSYNLSFAIFAQTSRTNISGPDSLRGKSIATYKGYALEKRLKTLLPESPIVQAEGFEGMFRLVASGKADAFVQEVHSGKYSLRRFWINNVEAK